MLLLKTFSGMMIVYHMQTQWRELIKIHRVRKQLRQFYSVFSRNLCIIVVTDHQMTKCKEEWCLANIALILIFETDAQTSRIFSKYQENQFIHSFCVTFTVVLLCCSFHLRT